MSVPLLKLFRSLGISKYGSGTDTPTLTTVLSLSTSFSIYPHHTGNIRLDCMYVADGSDWNPRQLSTMDLPAWSYLSVSVCLHMPSRFRGLSSRRDGGWTKGRCQLAMPVAPYEHVANHDAHYRQTLTLPGTSTSATQFAFTMHLHT